MTSVYLGKFQEFHQIGQFLKNDYKSYRKNSYEFNQSCDLLFYIYYDFSMLYVVLSVYMAYVCVHGHV